MYVFLILLLCGCSLTEGWIGDLPEAEKEFYYRIGSDAFSEADFIRVQRIGAYLAAKDRHQDLVGLLREPRIRAACAPYIDFLDYLLALSYKETGQISLSSHLFQKLATQRAEIVYQGQPLQNIVLQHLVETIDDPLERLPFMKRLLAYQGNSEQTVLRSFFLGKTYQEIGLWDQAIDSYRYTLSFPNATEILDQDSYNKIRSLIAYQNSPGNRVQKDLDRLIQMVKEAQERGNIENLAKLQASSDFVIRYWAQNENHHPTPEQDTFLRGLIEFSRNYNGENIVKWENGLSELSNSNEAYVKTTNWFAEWGTVHFYFRKVFYPPNPEIHDHWEWAGVLLGGK